jgi:chromosome segregation ATPase
LEKEGEDTKEKCKKLLRNKTNLANDLDNLDEQIYGIKNEAKAMKEARLNHEHEVKEAQLKAQQSRQKYDDLLANRPQTDSRQLLLHKQCLSEEANQINSLNDQLRIDLQSCESSIERIDAEIRKSSDVKDRRFQILTRSRAGQDAEQAYRFIQNNPNNFRGKVFGPLACEISITEPECAAFIERQVGAWMNVSFGWFGTYEVSDQ